MPASIREIVGVYHADGGVMGELRYVLGKARGTAHCALCDITHGSVRKKSEWRDLETDLDLPLFLVHLNEQPDELREFTRGRTPAVAWEDRHGFQLLFGPPELDDFDGSVTLFRKALLQMLVAKGPGTAGGTDDLDV